MPLRILIADDSATNRLLFKTTVTRMGHHADVVATGREAIDLFAQNGYDLVFLDIHMPVMDGIAAAQEIYRLNKQHTPVYAISGWADADTQTRALSAAMRDCLVKPLDREKLSRVIADCGLENHMPVMPSAQPQDIPKKLLAVYAAELRARAEACLRHYDHADAAGILRESHTLRALADMLKTPEVERTAAVLEETCRKCLRRPAATKDMQKTCLAPLQDMAHACHLAARAVERLS